MRVILKCNCYTPIKYVNLKKCIKNAFIFKPKKKQLVK